MLKGFYCPSEDVPEQFTVSDGGSNSWTLAQASYVACNGNDGVDDFTTPAHTGAFVRGTRGFGISQISDGLSNTAKGEGCRGASNSLNSLHSLQFVARFANSLHEVSGGVPATNDN